LSLNAAPPTESENSDSGIMDRKEKLKLELARIQPTRPGLIRRRNGFAGLLLTVALTQTALATENAPHRPFAQWADLPDAGQFVLGLVYEESEAYHIWASGKQYNVNVKAGGENYGIDINQGYFSLQYGINEKWAADLSVGGTTLAWRAFDAGNQPESTTGLMDFDFGVRYQIFKEDPENESPWTPTLTFRAGAVLPGTYDQYFIYAPGLRSAAIEPELLVRKHFGWPGLGAYGDALYRWNRTTGNDQYIVSAGLFQQIKGWELDVGYRHLQTISGGDIYFTDPTDLSTIVYPRDTREISDAIETGFSYTTSKRHIRYGFQLRTVVDGNNSDAKLWVGGSIDIPFGGKKRAQEPSCPAK
jgi:hypothetical protein